MTTQTTAHSNTSSISPHPLIKTLLAKKHPDFENQKEFLSWNLKDLPNLTDLQDIDKGAQACIDALDKGKQIGIFGDYDVDGTTSCALFYHFFEMLGHTPKIIQPSRFTDGYGLHPASVEKAIELGVDLLITVDCGITSCEAADYALERDIDLIITDHHKDAAPKMPSALAVINPNRRDEPEDGPLRPLAGVGVAFCLALAIKQKLQAKGLETPGLYPLLQFVAVGTLCDLAKLNFANLKLVRHGLKQLPQTQYPGLRAFLGQEERKLDVLPSEKVSFSIGPMINSKGRLDHPERALLLLTSPSSEIAYPHFAHLEVCNNQRKLIQSEVFKEAKEQVVQQISGQGEHLISIVYAPKWHEGVIGIVASKLVETFKVPALVFSDSEEEGIIKASARSAGELDLFACLDSMKDLFLKFGGHKAAAGLSMKKENLPELKSRMGQMLEKMAPIERMTFDRFDEMIDYHDISPKLVRDLNLLEPFGMGNERPFFKVTNLKVDSYKVLKEAHISWQFSAAIESSKNIKSLPKLKGISFYYLQGWENADPEQLFQHCLRGGSCTAMGQLGINKFRGTEFVQLLVKTIEA